MARSKKLPDQTGQAEDRMGEILGGGPGTPENHTAIRTDGHTDGEPYSHTASTPDAAAESKKVTFVLPRDLVEALRRRYHRGRLDGRNESMSGMVEDALRAYLGRDPE